MLLLLSPEWWKLFLIVLFPSGRGQRLQEALQLHHFLRESAEMEDWMNQQRQRAESQDLGNDYQQVQVSDAR